MAATLLPVLAIALLLVAGGWALSCWHSRSLSVEPPSDTDLKAILSATSALLYAKDREGRYLFANEATLRIVGRPWREVQGRTDEFVLPDPGDAGAVMEADRRIMETGIAETIEEVATNPITGVQHWLSTKTPLRRDGRITGLIGLSVEITERQRDTERLQQLQAEVSRTARLDAMSELSFALAHELNQPLAAIVNHLEIVRHQLSSTDFDPAAAQSRVDMALQQAVKGGHIVRRLRSLQSAVPMVMRPEPVGILLQDCAKLMSGFALARNSQISVGELDPELEITADYAQMMQTIVWIIAVILQDSAGSCEQASHIRIFSFRDSEHVNITVTHDGAPLAEDRRSMIGRRYSTTDEGADDVGLAISQRLVENHGGRLSYQILDDATACFVIELPLRWKPPER